MKLSLLAILLLPLLSTSLPAVPPTSTSLRGGGNGSGPTINEGSIIDIRESKTFDNAVFPLTLSPTDPSLTPSQFLSANSNIMSELLPKHGAILLRGFPVPDPHSFSAFIKSLNLQEQPYIGGNAVRRVVAPRVFTANESPPTEKIPFHHEMAQAPKFPSKVFFYCHQPSVKGGETPIVLSNEVCAVLRSKFPTLYRRFKEEGVKYIRTMPMDDDSESALGRGWKSTYQTDSKAVAEEEMRKAGTEWEWLANGDLKTTSKKLSAIRTVDGKEVFFNQVVAAYTGWNDKRNVGERAIVFGDSGEYLPEDDMKELVVEMDKLAVAFVWEQGDVLIIDNRLAMHSRKPFVKPRIVLASLAR